MRQNGGKNTPRTNGDERKRRTATKLIRRLRGVLVIQRQQRTADQNAPKRTERRFQTVQNRAPKNQLFQQGGQHGDYEKHADKPRAVRAWQGDSRVRIPEIF